MKIVVGFPPNFNEIADILNIRGKFGVIFTYGDTIYNPSGASIPDHLMKHEETHKKQQAKLGVEQWWYEYLKDSDFRLEQELEAYRAQYKVLEANYGRQDRRQTLDKIASDLAGQMYGKVVSKAEAKKLIKA